MCPFSFSFFIYTSRIPRLSTAGFVRAVVPGTEGPPSSGPDVSLLAHPGRRQPAVEGEMQGRRWVPILFATDSDLEHAVAQREQSGAAAVGDAELKGAIGSVFTIKDKTRAVIQSASVSRLLIGIDEPLPLKKRKIVKPGFTHSPWKSAYIRQHRIDTNWRRGDLKSPKVALPFNLNPPAGRGSHRSDIKWLWVTES